MSKGDRNIHIRIALWTICLFLTGITGELCAQDIIPEITPGDTTIVNDTILSANNSITLADDTIVFMNDSVIPAGDSIIIAYDSAFFQDDNTTLVSFTDSTITAISENNPTIEIKESTFKPNPKTAYLVAMVFPGFGQVYNRQYWKLPIIYGGLMGCAYAITWNNKTYQDYKEAYFDIMTDAKNDPNGENPDSWHTSWQEFLSSTRNPADYLHNSHFQSQLKRGKDNFRRYRDLSIIITGLVYMLCVADSYVDAQMFDFDVSPDLSFRVTPEFRPETLSTSRSYGFNVCMTF